MNLKPTIMIRNLITIIAVLIGTSAYSQLGLYLGIRGGGGAMLTQNQVTNLPTSDGAENVFSKSSSWTGNVKGEALLGVWRLRLGYQVMHDFSGPSSTYISGNPQLSPAANTTYFNSSQTRILAQYFLLEIALIHTRHFNLVPGVAVGSYNGYKIDQTTGDQINFSETTRRRFSVGAELNFEIVYGRCTFLFGPNYYLFDYKDKLNDSWHEYQHMIGGDIGFRVNLIKPKG
jgi:hypothetical protein